MAIRLLRSIGLWCLLALFFCSCTSHSTRIEEYIAIYKRDTAYLTLHLYPNSYHGKMLVKGAGNFVEKGSIEGDIKGDTLLGSYLYKPYKAKFTKRRAFVLKRTESELLQGSGLESVYMGVPYYDPASINFEAVKFVFKRSTE